jgi:hypothetical protein
MKAFAALILAAAVALPVLAQEKKAPESIAKMADVKGLVTSSSGDQMVSGQNGTLLTKGSRVVTTSSGYVTLKFKNRETGEYNGCDIHLKPNEVLGIEERDCAALLLAVRSIAPAGGTVTAGAGAGSGLPGSVLPASGLGSAAVFRIPPAYIGASFIGVGAIMVNQTKSKLSGS